MWLAPPRAGRTVCRAGCPGILAARTPLVYELDVGTATASSLVLKPFLGGLLAFLALVFRPRPDMASESGEKGVGGLVLGRDKLGAQQGFALCAMVSVDGC